MLTPAQTQFLEMAANAAVRSETLTGVPAELTLSQAILESGWGSRAPFNNCFGLKANGRGCGQFVVPTAEFVNGVRVIQQLAFEKYSSLMACFNDHGWLISKGAPYAAAFSRFKLDHDVTALIAAVGKVYATAPNYSSIILELAKSANVAGAIANGRALGVAHL